MPRFRFVGSDRVRVKFAAMTRQRTHPLRQLPRQVEGENQYVMTRRTDGLSMMCPLAIFSSGVPAG